VMYQHQHAPLPVEQLEDIVTDQFKTGQ
jgi:hypothetical protein